MVGPGATDGDQAPAERLASQRAASLRALFPTGARSTTPPPQPEPAPPPEVTPEGPAPRRRRLPVVVAVATAFALGTTAGVVAVAASGRDSPSQPIAAPASAAPLGAGPYDAEPTASVSPEPSGTPAASATPSSPPTPPATTTAPVSPTKPAGQPNPSRANLALNRPVTASGSEGHPWPPGAVVDGKPDTRWSSAFTDRQWIAIDLGQVWSVGQVRLAWEHAHATRYTVEVSLDAKAWSKVYSTSSGVGGTVDIDIDIDTGGAAARYVRLVCTKRSGSYGYSLFEIEVR